MDDLTIERIVAKLTVDQMRAVILMLDPQYKTKKDVAKEMKIPVATIYGWGDIIDDALKAFLADQVAAAIEVRKAYLLKSMRVMGDLLEDDKPTVRKGAAEHIIEGVLGKAKVSADLGVALSEEMLAYLDKVSVAYGKRDNEET